MAVLILLTLFTFSYSYAQVKVLVSPAQNEIAVEEVFTVEVNVESGMQQIDGANIFFSFDPLVLQVQSVTAGSTLSMPIVSINYNNSTGEIDYAYGLLSDQASGNFNLFTVQFKAVAVGISNLEFVTKNDIETDLSFRGASVLDLLVNGQVSVNEPNSAPVIQDQSFTVEEGSADGTVVGTVSASDPEGDVLTYSITAGNASTAFAINASTGELTVANSSAVDISVNPDFILTIEVSDGSLASSATVTVTVTEANSAPVVQDQSFTVEEGSADGTVVGTVSASDPEGDVLTYSITAGNASTAFAINPSTGELTVANSSAVDISVNPDFILTIEVSDGSLTSSATVTVTVTEVNSAPVVQDQSFTVEEGSADGTIVGTVLASDPEGDVLTYSITAGNASTAFVINSSTGELTVFNSSELDFDVNPMFSLTVEVNDGILSSSAIITVNLEDVPENQSPQIEPQTFTIAENSANGTVVGTVVASDPEGDMLSYSILSGNTNNTFNITAATGELTVADSTFLDFEAHPAFTLIVEASDGSLNSSANISINLTDVDDDITGVERDLSPSIKIFPNPANDYILVKSEKFIFDSVVIRLFDIDGKPLDNSVYKTDIETYKVKVTGLNTGIYILLIKCNGQTTAKRVFKK